MKSIAGLLQRSILRNATEASSSELKLSALLSVRSVIHSIPLVHNALEGILEMLPGLLRMWLHSTRVIVALQASTCLHTKNML